MLNATRIGGRLRATSTTVIVTSATRTAGAQPYTTAAPTMKTFASEVAPTATPSIGTGNASATTDATSSAASPASVLADGSEETKDQVAATLAAVPPAATGTTRESRRT